MENGRGKKNSKSSIYSGTWAWVLCIETKTTGMKSDQKQKSSGGTDNLSFLLTIAQTHVRYEWVKYYYIWENHLGEENQHHHHHHYVYQHQQHSSAGHSTQNRTRESERNVVDGKWKQKQSWIYFYFVVFFVNEWKRIKTFISRWNEFLCGNEIEVLIPSKTCNKL